MTPATRCHGGRKPEISIGHLHQLRASAFAGAFSFSAPSHPLLWPGVLMGLIQIRRRKTDRPSCSQPEEPSCLQ